ncbi:MAG: nitroreductase family protein [Actinobacteria bacterium]|nr:nitroreductase family protein [Actinomycetota bacterium]
MKESCWITNKTFLCAQNVYLQAVSLNLGTVVVGAFQDDTVRLVINMPDEECPLYIMPIGKK